MSRLMVVDQGKEGFSKTEHLTYEQIWKEAIVHGDNNTQIDGTVYFPEGRSQYFEDCRLVCRMPSTPCEYRELDNSVHLTK